MVWHMAFSAAFDAGPSCENQAIEQLVDIQRNAIAYARKDGLLAEGEPFYAQQNAQTVRNAEVYYRAMFSGLGLSPHGTCATSTWRRLSKRC